MSAMKNSQNDHVIDFSQLKHSNVPQDCQQIPTYNFQLPGHLLLGSMCVGQSSTMTGTYTGQFVMGGFLDIRFSAWLRVTITRSIAILPTLFVAVIYRNSKGNQLDILNEWLNILNSVQLPFALIPVRPALLLSIT